MTVRKKFSVLAGLALIVFFSSSALGITAKSFRQGLMANPNIAKTSGEMFSWHASAGIGGFIQGYYAYGKDKAWLEEASIYYDFLISKMEKEPDGYMGWVGPYFGLEPEVGAVVIGDANLIDPMLAFSEIVMKDPALKSTSLGVKAEGYIALARKTLVEKWDKRGGYYEDGMFASYLSTGIIIDQKTHQLRALAGKKWSENLNKHGRMALCFLKLYRITGEQMFRDRAEKIFGHYKAIMRYSKDEDRYFWNFWEPLAPFDWKGSKPQSWVDVHPYRSGYQVFESSAFVEAYHTGVVFSEEDMKKVINTNLWMWNKSLTDIHFKSANGKPTGEENGKVEDAGALWPSLAEFDPKIREIYAAELKKRNNEVETAYFKNIICKEPPSFKRKYVTGEVKLPDIPVYPSKDIGMAVCIPSHISAGKNEEMKIGCKVMEKGTVKITLFSEDGKTPLFEIGGLESARANDIYYMKWNGKDRNGQALKGNYRVRFTMNDSTREWRIKLEE